MEIEIAADFALGALSGAVAGGIAMAGMLRAVRREGRLAPERLMKATAWRFGLTLLVALVLGLALDPASALRAIGGLALSYAVILVVETRWALARVRREAAGSEKRRADVGQ
jgi:hypothetical protein